MALALPLLLFSMDVKAWSRLAGKATLCMLLATISIIAVALGGYMIIRHEVPYAWQLGGMAVGLYTGGTPNLAAIKTALHVSSDVYITMHTYDTVISLIYILFFCSVAQKLFNLFLPRFKSRAATSARDDAETESIDSYRGILSRGSWPALLGAFAVAILILGASLGLAELFPGEYGDAVTILAITTLGIACSFIPRIRKIKKTFQAGMYLIYVFCLVVGSMANLRELFTRMNWPILAFVTLCIFGSLIPVSYTHLDVYKRQVL